MLVWFYLGADFQNITTKFLINDRISSGCVVFQPVDDQVLENNEAVVLVLGTDDEDVDIDINQFTVTIIDNEGIL